MGANVPAWLPKLLNAAARVVENKGEAVLGEAVGELQTDDKAAASTEE